MENNNVEQPVQTPVIKTEIQDVSTYQTKWNWGAFVSWMFFSVGNRTYLGFLNLIPVFNIFWIFWTAAHAELWALENPDNNYRDEEEFRKVMDSWNRGGLVIFLVSLLFLILYSIFIFSIISAMITSGNQYR